MNSILILAPRASKRFEYIARYLLEDLLGLSLCFTEDQKAFCLSDLPKFSILESQEASLYFYVDPWLLDYQLEILPEKDLESTWGEHLFFPSKNKKSAFKTDYFSSAFYLLTRYEEYRATNKDAWGRFKAENSYQFKKNLLQRALVNEWALELKEVLGANYPQLQFKQSAFCFLPTMDVDQCWAYKNKGLLRNLASLAKHPKEFRSRFLVQLNRKKDPIDSLEDWAKLFEEFQIPSKIFILCAKYGFFKKTIDNSNPCHYSSFARELALLEKEYKYLSFGIHASFLSNLKPYLFQKEINDLQALIFGPIRGNRQHYLVLNFPSSYQNLEKAGIKEDYSLGYPNYLGFRAGVCTPYYFYDLEKDEKRDLKIFPLSFMDGYPQKSGSCPQAALKDMENCLDYVYRLEGCFQIIMHNDSFAGFQNWEGWKPKFDSIIHRALSLHKEARGDHDSD